jgi:hypothetical protein
VSDRKHALVFFPRPLAGPESSTTSEHVNIKTKCVRWSGDAAQNHQARTAGPKLAIQGGEELPLGPLVNFKQIRIPGLEELIARA